MAIQGLKMVGEMGFEPMTFWSRTKRATRLRYSPFQAGSCLPKDCLIS